MKRNRVQVQKRLSPLASLRRCGTEGQCADTPAVGRWPPISTSRQRQPRPWLPADPVAVAMPMASLSVGGVLHGRDDLPSQQTAAGRLVPRHRLARPNSTRGVVLGTRTQGGREPEHYLGCLGLLLGRHRGRLWPPADQGRSGFGSVDVSDLDWVSTMFGNVKQTLEGTCLRHLAEFGYHRNRRFDLALPVLAVAQMEVSLDDRSVVSAMTRTKDEGRPYGHQDGMPHSPLREMLLGRWCLPLEKLSSLSWSIHEIHTPSETSLGVMLRPRRWKARARLLSEGFRTRKAEE